MVTVTFVTDDGERYAIDAPAGASLMRAARAHNVPGILAQCGGACMCATCHVFLDDDWLARAGPRTRSELETLPYAIDVGDNSRLSCQITVTDELEGMIVHIPKAQV